MLCPAAKGMPQEQASRIGSRNRLIFVFSILLIARLVEKRGHRFGPSGFLVGRGTSLNWLPIRPLPNDPAQALSSVVNCSCFCGPHRNNRPGRYDTTGACPAASGTSPPFA